MKVAVGTVATFLPVIAWADLSSRLAALLPAGTVIFWSEGVGWAVITGRNGSYTINGVRPLRDHLRDDGLFGLALEEALRLLADPVRLAVVAGVIGS